MIATRSSTIGALLRLAAVLLALQAAPAIAQRLGQGTGVDVPIWRILGALAFCLALAVGAAFLLRRRLNGPNPIAFGRNRRLQLVECLRLSHQVDVCIVACDGAEFILASSPQGPVLINGAPLASAPMKDAQ